MGHVVDHVFVFLQLIRLVRERAKDQTQLVLARRNLVVVFVDLHAHALHRGEHFGPQVLGCVGWVYWEVAALNAGTVAHVAHVVFSVCVPGCVLSVDFERHFVHRVREPNVVEQKEFSFGTKVGHVADAGRLEVSFGFFGCAAGVTRVGFAGVGLNHGAVNADGFFGVERVKIDAVRVGHQFHVRLFDGFPPSDGRAVEHEAFVQEVFVYKVSYDRNVL